MVAANDKDEDQDDDEDHIGESLRVTLGVVLDQLVAHTGEAAAVREIAGMILSFIAGTGRPADEVIEDAFDAVLEAADVLEMEQTIDEG